MGFLDFLTGGEKAQVERHARRMRDINTPVEERELSAHWLAERGTESEDAILGLLGRFSLTLEHQMKDAKEKELVFDLLVELGPRVVEPTKRWIRSQGNFAQPLRLVEHFEGEEGAVGVLLELLEKEKDPFKPERKRRVLIKLAEHKHPRIRDAAIPCLRDFDEGIRYAAVEALLAQGDPDVREPLAAAMANPEEESNRLRVRIAEGFRQRGWTV